MSPDPRTSDVQPATDAASTDPHRIGRRLILKLGVTGAAGLIAGVGQALPGAAAAQGADAARSAVPLPYAKNIMFIGSRTVITDRSGKEGEYVLNGSGSLFIDPQGRARLIGLKIAGRFAGGSLDLGPIAIESTAGGDSGRYVRGKLRASGAVLFSGGRFRRQAGHASVSGNLYDGAGNVELSVDLPGFSTGVVIGKRAFAC